jgi:hypothetical protein
MSDNDPSQKKVSTTEKGALAEKERDPREEQMSVPLAEKVSGPEHILEDVAETQSGDELDFRSNKGIDSRGNYYERQHDYDWTRDPEVSPGRRHGDTLAQQERRAGREAEMDRHREVARDADAAGLERAASSRAQCGVDTPYQQTTADERPDVEPSDEADPRGWLQQDELAAVNQVAASLADEMARDIHLGRAGLAKLVAQRVLGGADALDAGLAVKRSLQQLPNVAETFEEIDVFTTWKTTVEAEVDYLFETPAVGQFQAGYLEDDEGERRKFVYWSKSHQSNGMPTLRVGDRVRLEGVMVNEWNGKACLAITGKHTDIIIEERGGGPMHRTGQAGDDPSKAPWDVESDTHAWVESVDISHALKQFDQ